MRTLMMCCLFIMACGSGGRVTLHDWYGPNPDRNGLDLVNGALVADPAQGDVSLSVRSIHTLLTPHGACPLTDENSADALPADAGSCTWAPSFTGEALVRDRAGGLHRVQMRERVGPLENGGGGSIVVEFTGVD
jgi:hypothetical protein